MSIVPIYMDPDHEVTIQSDAVEETTRSDGYLDVERTIPSDCYLDTAVRTQCYALADHNYYSYYSEPSEKSHECPTSGNARLPGQSLLRSSGKPRKKVTQCPFCENELPECSGESEDDWLIDEDGWSIDEEDLAEPINKQAVSDMMNGIYRPRLERIHNPFR